MQTTKPVVCPKCGGRLIRIHRQFFDRVVSVVRPVHRVHCTICKWEGRMRATGFDRYSTRL